ncbi:hypothetical protein WA026_013873 [Henosepilachna vigintioctopunctata]|uniref:Uncharacterized protein n=1 Tax=Henosepilachna vigintioctopunctata TaxID=420089 RepID=A0AAW1U7C2_9CUCU
MSDLAAICGHHDNDARGAGVMQRACVPPPSLRCPRIARQHRSKMGCVEKRRLCDICYFWWNSTGVGCCRRSLVMQNHPPQPPPPTIRRIFISLEIGYVIKALILMVLSEWVCVFQGIFVHSEFFDDLKSIWCSQSGKSKEPNSNLACKAEGRSYKTDVLLWPAGIMQIQFQFGGKRTEAIQNSLGNIKQYFHIIFPLDSHV